MTEPVDRLHPALLHHIVNSLGWPRLRELQVGAIDPLLAGDDALLLAATASGKTEAAMFPLLSNMVTHNWSGTSIVYLCPLKALLNNLGPRLSQYTSWLGRSAAVWHGDVTDPARRAILRDRPDILLTTPESMEAMLVSANVDHERFFSNLRTVVVDEVHAFAGDDRGWHLRALLERLTHLLGRPLQRIGLSATVGNPDALLAWLQGAEAGRRPAHVVAPDRPRPSTVSTMSPPAGHIELDYVGSLENAATVIASLHRGEKRLVFCESRKQVEELGHLLRAKNIATFLSHASLSVADRQRSELAFAEARDCVIISTSTLELGVDVGDLDRVVQIDAPRTVASFLQRLGRTGRRASTTRNCLLLASSHQSLLQATGLLVQWGRGWVEPVVAPPDPRHIVAQQILALCLQQGQVGDKQWREWWNGLEPFTGKSDAILRYLLEEGYLERDGGMLFIGPEAELRFGRRHFMAMTAVFTSPSQFTVLAGRTELGRIDAALLSEESPGPRRLLLSGRHWQVTHVDWTRRHCFVEPTDDGGRARWTSGGVTGLSYELSRAMRDVILGADPPVTITRRAAGQLAEVRGQMSATVDAEQTVVTRSASGDLRWWTWAGHRANATLASSLDTLVDSSQGHGDLYLRLRKDLTAAEWHDGIKGFRRHDSQLRLPSVSEKAVAGLKFSAALPRGLAEATLAARLADLPRAFEALHSPARFTIA